MSKLNRRQLAAGLLAASQAGAASTLPNLVFILSDDHSVPFLGAYGDPVIQTPNLDRFAREGMRLDKMFTAAPQCVPSRTAFLTGRSPVACRMGRFTSPLPADMTRLLGAVLATRGLTAVSAYDAIQGFLVAQRQHPKFILVDWHMPAGGGPQLLRKLKDNPATHGIPVVVVTADGSPAIPEEAMALGARGVLHKPIDTDHFVEVVKSLVE